MSECAVLLLAFAAAACGCVSIDKHGTAVFGGAQKSVVTACLRAASWMLAAASYASAIAIHGVGIGTIEWICLIGLAAIAVGVLVALRPRWLPPAGAAALAGAVGLTFL